MSPRLQETVCAKAVVCHAPAAVRIPGQPPSNHKLKWLASNIFSQKGYLVKWAWQIFYREFFRSAFFLGGGPKKPLQNICQAPFNYIPLLTESRFEMWFAIHTPDTLMHQRSLFWLSIRPIQSCTNGPCFAIHTPNTSAVSCTNGPCFSIHTPNTGAVSCTNGLIPTRNGCWFMIGHLFWACRIPATLVHDRALVLGV